jgi:O-antigen ligase
MNLGHRLRSFSTAASFELWPTLLLLTGVVAFNQSFTEVAFRQLHVTEVLLFGTLALALLSAAYSPRHAQVLRWLAGRPFRLFHLLALYSSVWLMLRYEHGPLVTQHAMIALRSALVALFAFAFVSRHSLLGTLKLLFLLSSVFNGLKILHNWAVGARMEFEPLRVAHNETDVICASLSLIGIVVALDRLNLRRGLLLLPLAVLNVMVLVVTLRRTAALGLLVVILLVFSLSGSPGLRRSVARVGAVAVLFLLLMLTGFALLGSEHLPEIFRFLLGKVRFSTEANAVWRLEAWDLTWARFTASPWVGIGYGSPILQTALKSVPNSDPHNSFLTFLLRHGLLGTCLLLAILGQAVARYVKALRLAKSDTERSVTLFFFMSLVYMVIFACFNVVLETWHQGLFFWLAVSGAFLPYCPTTTEPARLFLVPLRGVAAVAALGYALLVLGPSNHLPRIDIYSSKQQAQLPHAEAPAESRLQIAAGPGALLVDSDQRGPVAPALTWVIPAQFNRAVRLRRALDRLRAPAGGVLPPHGRARVGAHVVAVEFASPAHAARRYTIRLVGNRGGDPPRAYEATGYMAGTTRIVPFEEFGSHGDVPWEHLREVSIVLPDSPVESSRELSIAIRALRIVHLPRLPQATPVAPCSLKNELHSDLITDFEREEGEGTASHLAFGYEDAWHADQGNDLHSARGYVWSADDGTGHATMTTTTGAEGSNHAIRVSNRLASAWGHSLGIDLECADARAFEGVQFWVRGTTPERRGRLTLRMRQTTPPGMKVANVSGSCVGTDPLHDCEAASAEFPIGAGWGHVRILWSTFSPGFSGSALVTPRGNDLLGLVFTVDLPWQPETRSHTPAPIEFALDDVRFIPGGSRPESRSEEPR